MCKCCVRLHCRPQLPPEVLIVLQGHLIHSLGHATTLLRSWLYPRDTSSTPWDVQPAPSLCPAQRKEKLSHMPGEEWAAIDWSSFSIRILVKQSCLWPQVRLGFFFLSGKAKEGTLKQAWLLTTRLTAAILTAPWLPQGPHPSEAVFCPIPNHCPLNGAGLTTHGNDSGAKVFSLCSILSCPGGMDSVKLSRLHWLVYNQSLFSSFPLKQRG